MFRAIILIISIAFAIQDALGETVLEVSNQVSCPYSSDEITQLRKGLCNENSNEYDKKSGANCFEDNLRERMQDTSVQLYITKLCGFAEYHDQLMLTLNESIPTFQNLGECAGFKVDVQKLWESVNAKTVGLIAGQKCTSKVRALIQRQIPKHLQKYKAGKEAMKQSGMEFNNP
jgi:hypothetical protein